MGNEIFYIIRFPANGYECSVIAFGDEQTVIKRFQTDLNGTPFTAIRITRQIAYGMCDLGFKVYYCVDTTIQETNIPTIMESAPEEFTSNT
jgi:hypothetical protein